MTNADDLAAGTDAVTGDRAMTRSEEQLNVGVQARPVTRAVLRKYIVTEEVTRTFTVRREEVRLEQVPVERVRLRKEVLTEYVAVGDQLRKERIELDVDDRQAR